MTVPNSDQKTNESSTLTKTYISGSILILMGILFFVEQIVQSPTFGALMLPGLGLIFIAWALLLRNFGLLIPGGILTGIGFGILFMDYGPAILAGVDDGALFMIVFGLGWGLITLLSPLTEGRFVSWPLIPGGIIGGIGVFLLLGDVGETVLNLLSYLWPLLLVALGVFIIIKQYRSASS